jgi:hypothetical protein
MIGVNVLESDLVAPGSGKIWLDNVQCNGSERSIVNCRLQEWGVHSCNHSDDVVVMCNLGIFILRL